MSAGRDKKARTKERRQQTERSLLKRAAIKEAQLARRAAYLANRRVLKAKNAVIEK
jgi:hypothetical protein